MHRSTLCPVSDQLSQAIENNELVLPVMPEWAMKVNRMLDDMNISAGQIVSALSGDPVFASQLIKTANSAAYAGKSKVDNVSTAVSRLGFKILRNLIVSASMNKLAVTSNPKIQKHLTAFWEHSREVAAISHVLSRSQKHLNQDQAMLAGLTHDIGSLPLFIHIDKHAIDFDNDILEKVLTKCRAKVSEQLLKTWGFSLELVEVPVAHEDIYREQSSQNSSYADVVTIANLLNRVTAKTIDWNKITAVKRMGLRSELYRDFFEIYDNDLRAAREIFS